MEINIKALKERFVTACRILFNEGLIENAYSMSCRLDQKQMLMNPRGSPLLVTAENIMTQPSDDRPKNGGDTKGINLHAAIYKARKDVNAIVHAHPPYAIALGTVEEPFQPVHDYGVIFDGIKVYKSHGKVQTKERGLEIARQLADARAILQRGHGTVVVGKDLQEAVVGTIYLEQSARIHYFAKAMGTPQYIPHDVSTQMARKVLKESPNRWDHYAAKLKLRSL